MLFKKLRYVIYMFCGGYTVVANRWQKSQYVTVTVYIKDNLMCIYFFTCNEIGFLQKN